jgi:hypothetical protein
MVDALPLGVYPEGPVVEQRERILVRCACGHLTFRSALVPEQMLGRENFGVADHFWSQQPCDGCEPYYGLALLNWMKATLSEQWSRGAYAKDRKKHPIEILDDRAVQWNLVGAVYRARMEVQHIRVTDWDADELTKHVVWILARLATNTETADATTNVQRLLAWEMQPFRKLEEVLVLVEKARGEALTAIARLIEKAQEVGNGGSD